MSSKKENALATRAPENEALAIPDFMREDTDALALNTPFEQSELKLPMLRLCQGQTPQRQRGNENFIDKLQEGDFFNDLTGTVYGREKLRVMPLKFWTNIAKFTPLEQGGGLICRAQPGGQCECSRALDKGLTPHGVQWGATGEKPPCTQFFNYLFYLPDHQEVVWYSAKSTAIPPAKLYNSQLRIAQLQLVPDFAKVSELSSAFTKGDGNKTWYTPKFTPVVHILGNPKRSLFGSTASEQALYARLKKLTQGYQSAVIDTSRAEADDQQPASDAIPF